MTKSFQKILVPFDNSLSAQKALNIATDMTKKFNSTLHAIYVERNGEESQKTEVIQAIKSHSDEHGVEIELIEKKGSPYKEIISTEKEITANVIIMGTHGRKGWQPFWMGSNAFRVVSASNCPVITILESTGTENLDAILLPLADSFETRQKVPYAAILAKAYGSVVHVLGVSKAKDADTSNRVHAYVRQTEKYLRDREIEYTVDFKLGVKVPEACIEHAQEKKVGLIPIMTETENAGWFMDTYSQQLVNTSPVPVMSIHSRDMYLTGDVGY